jgi:hypothetical protein
MATKTIVSKSKGAGTQKVTPAEVANRVNLATAEKATPAPAKNKAVAVPKKETPTPVKVPAKPVTNIADKQVAKKATTTPVNTTTAKETTSAKPTKSENESHFDDVIKGKDFNYNRIAGNKITPKELREHLATGTFPIHMLAEEGRNDGNLAHYVLCYVSKTSLSFINQTINGGEDWDALIQLEFDDILGLDALIDHRKNGKTKLFPCALYIKESK